MRILHTSDIHLTTDNELAFDALDCILDTCKARSVDLLTIGGDMFHKPQDVELLRTRLRKVFSGLDFDVLSIPGNHDQIAYTRNLDFGDSLKMVTKEPFEVVSYENVNIIAVPYTELLKDEDYILLREAVKNDKFNILLLHCTLDIGYGSQDFGEEEAKRYCPVSSTLLSSFGYHVVLGGHFHKEYYLKEIGAGRKFVYPGSPVSLSWKELGQRQTALIDTDTEDIIRVPLASHFFEKKSVTVFPSKEADTLKSIEEWGKQFDGMSCKLAVDVNGFGEMDETEFNKALNGICVGWEVVNEYRNVENVLSHSLYKRFEAKLDELVEVDKEHLKKTVIEVFSEMLAGRKIE